ncbi:MAG TPA: serine/threonine-protein kinase [Steroidobacteraceae bacterium]|nr:serine/threonine-protein kinase [Steroidobacteraceae bacterium]
MNPTDQALWRRVSDLLDQLLGLPESERDAALARMECDDTTGAELRRLLAAVRKSDRFLERAHKARRPQLLLDSLAPASRIGAYRVEKLLARGGMGEVYRAHRADGQFEKPVALKLARVEMTPRAGRFNNERQILASLEHPGIARLLDGGLTEDGRPYMVMELVEGSDILSYCRKHHLGWEERLILFGQVCEAVGYAHRHLVVHRDLKPNNILVSTDGRVKLLDFGIAKLLGADEVLEAQATLTLMTPDYAAPEQMEGKPPTTATDVYALGVLLYQLLAGRPPWDLHELPLPAALQRLLHTSPCLLSETAADNPLAPVSPRLLRGDLDAIVAKALRSEPEARYRSALALWEDVLNHTSHRPVLARGDARGYLARRFLRRNRLWVGAAIAVFASLLAGLAGTLWQAREADIKARQAEWERDRARVEASRAQSVVDYLDLMFGTAVEQAVGRSPSAKEMLDASAEQLSRRFADKPAEKARVLQVLGDLYLTLHDFEGAAPVLSRFLDSADAGADPEARAHIQLDLAMVEFDRGNLESAQRLLTQAQHFWDDHTGRYRAQLVHSRSLQSQIQGAHGDVPGAIQTLRQALAESVALNGETAEDTMTLAGDLGVTLMLNNQLEEADQMMNRAWNDLQAAGRSQTEEGMTLLNNIAVNAVHRNDLPRAEKLLREVIDLRKQSFGPSAALAMQENNLGKVLLRAGRPREALPLLDEALAMSQRFTGDHSQDTVRVYQTEAEVRLDLEDVKTAEPFVQFAMDRARAAYGEKSPMYGYSLTLQARLRLLQGKRTEATRLAGEAERNLAEAGDTGTYYLPPLRKLKAELAAGR